MSGEPTIAVGIVEAPLVNIEGGFSVEGSPSTLRGRCTARPDGESVLVECEGTRARFQPGVLLRPSGNEPSFLLKGVTIGVNFHWERQEDQRFTGALRLLRRGEHVVAVNVVPLEEYLASVISSEMSASSSMNLLRAHAIASRSWLIAQLDRSRALRAGAKRPATVREESGLRVRWYDREDHDLYDVCADDHCQRYQGITNAATPSVRRAIDETRGEVLLYGGAVCDARFSKSCGGITEPFDTVWEEKRVPYLVNIRDLRAEGERIPDASAKGERNPDVSAEPAAGAWIRSSPDAFCNTADREILSHVLLKYDQETADFYRWTVTYAQDEIAAIVRERSGVDFGAIRDLVPLERGPSGRLKLLNIVGEKKTLS
ncbi:MAG TPA: SpoIID/LytB domain-containing protein, partial [Bacteroidota bacterium]|nr:SpoIID/LytB domain-containing protein [Bacteroidota bacterium]